MDDLLSFLINFGLLLLFLIIWSLIWKGVALWHAARNNSLPWFIILLLVNTLGILEILYIFLIEKKQDDNLTPPVQPKM